MQFVNTYRTLGPAWAALEFTMENPGLVSAAGTAFTWATAGFNVIKKSKGAAGAVVTAVSMAEARVHEQAEENAPMLNDVEMGVVNSYKGGGLYYRNIMANRYVSRGRRGGMRRGGSRRYVYNGGGVRRSYKRRTGYGRRRYRRRY